MYTGYMKITKFGHCCLLIEEGGIRLLTDPGSFTVSAHSQLTNINVILYTHEHGDHYHRDSLKQLMQSNPGVMIICNTGVSALLEVEGIAHTTVADGAHDFSGVSIRGVSGEHEAVHASIPRIQNTGFMIGKRLWYPGDAFITPSATPEIVALPLAGPWMKLSDAIDYAISLSPKVAFAVHDAVLSVDGQAIHHRVASGILGLKGIALQQFEIGKEYEF